MKRIMGVGLAVLMIGAVGAPAAQASPKIGYHQAESAGYHNLRQVSIWRYRTYGALNCKNGRISRSDWSCRYYVEKGNTCGLGKIRVHAYGSNRVKSFLKGKHYPC